MTRPRDPRGANRRGSDNTDLGYVQPAGTRHTRTWDTPRDVRGIIAMRAQRERTGACVVCHEVTDAPGVTCKSLPCLRAWLFGG